MADYDEALHLNPQFVEAYNNRGAIRRERGDIIGAIADYRNYLKFGGGQKYNNQQQVERAIEALEKRLKEEK